MNALASIKNSPALAGDIWGGVAAMLVALPSAIAFGVAIVAPLGGALGAQGAVAGILGATALGLIAPLAGDRARLVTAPCAPAAAVLSALAAGFAQSGVPAEKALKRPWPMWFRMASARMLRAELWVHKKSTFNIFKVL